MQKIRAWWRNQFEAGELRHFRDAPTWALATVFTGRWISRLIPVAVVGSVLYWLVW